MAKMATLIAQYVTEIGKLERSLKTYNNTGSQSCIREISRMNGMLQVFYAVVNDLENPQKKGRAVCCLGEKASCPLNVNGVYCSAQECQYQVVEVLD